MLRSGNERKRSNAASNERQTKRQRRTNNAATDEKRTTNKTTNEDKKKNGNCSGSERQTNCRYSGKIKLYTFVCRSLPLRMVLVDAVFTIDATSVIVHWRSMPLRYRKELETKRSERHSERPMVLLSATES